MFKIKTALVALALLFASLAHAAIGTPTSAGSGGATTSVASLAFTTTAALVAGNHVVVAIAMKSSAGASVSSVSDGTNSYTQAAFKVSTNGTVDRVELWYKENAAAVSSGATLTITLSAALGATNPGINAGIVQLSGMLTASSLDSAAIGNAFNNSGTTLTATTGTLATNNEIVFGVLTQGAGSAYTESATFTNIFADVGGANRGALSLGYDIVSATTAVGYTPSVATLTGLAAIAAPFKGAAAPPKTDTLAMMGVGSGGAPVVVCDTTAQLLTATGAGTWTNTTNCTNFTVRVIAGGAGGSSSIGGHATGGGAGESCVATTNIGASAGFNIGTGGTGSVGGGTDGTAGGNTWFCSGTANCATIGGSAVVAGGNGGGIGHHGTGNQAGGPGGSGGVGTCVSGGSGGAATGASGAGATGGGGAAGHNTFSSVMNGGSSASTSNFASGGGVGNVADGSGGTGSTTTTPGGNGGNGSTGIQPGCPGVGSGGGGGAHSNNAGSHVGAGDGGLYGAGGGATQVNSGNDPAGNGKQGAICIEGNF
jgi:hypothetical protein